jgi:glycosyltransferase involved in cell wall biosynthesis
MRIVICRAHVPFEWGGAEIFTQSLKEELEKRGHEADVVALPFKWYPKIEIIKNCLAWRMLDLSATQGVKIDAAICTNFPSYVLKHPTKIMWLNHQFRAVYDLRGTEFDDFLNASPEEKVIRDRIVEIDKKVIPESKKIFSQSKNIGNRLKKFNGVDSTTLYLPPPNENKYHCKEYGGYILYVGRLARLKRPDLLLKAMLQTKTDAKCVIVGEAIASSMELWKQLKSMAESIPGKVEFKGKVSDEELVDLYANCSAVFYAPYDEDYGLVTIEAFKSKKPVITAPDSGGVLEFVEDGKTGFVTGTPIETAKRIDQLCSDKDLCKKLGMAGYQKVKDIRWDSAIEKLLGGI